MRIVPRSGLSENKFINLGVGLVDADYRVGVVLINNGNQDFQVKQGDRIAQLLLKKVSTPSIQEVQTLDETTRGIGAFGSTGMMSTKKENELMKVRTTNDIEVKSKRTSNMMMTQRQFITPKQLKKILKKSNEQCFLATVRLVKEEENAKHKCMTGKVKRELMNEKGAIRTTPPVEETRQKICSEAPVGIKETLKSNITKI